MIKRFNSNYEHLEVNYQDPYTDDTIFSKVYSVDAVRNRFLVIDSRKKFLWINIDECNIVGVFEE